MSPKKFLYLSDRPVEREDDILWGERPGAITDYNVLQQIENIAERLAAPLIDEKNYPENLSDSMTFAIHGKWGSGKSSFLKMVKAHVEELVKDKYNRDPENLQKLDTHSNRHKRYIKFCDFIASSYVNTLTTDDLRTSLAMKILMALVTEEDKKPQQEIRAAALKKYYEAVSIDSSKLSEKAPQRPEGSEDSDKESYKLKEERKLYDVAATLANFIGFPDFLNYELTGGSAEDKHPMVMVVIIDDLDRVPEMTSDILNITQQWGNVKNLFFILSINREVLLENIKGQSSVGLSQENPDYALEKYIQHSFTIPELCEKTLRFYVQQLLQDYSDPAAKVLSEATDLLEKGLKIKTPRSVKRCLNSILSPIQVEFAEIQKRSKQSLKTVTSSPRENDDTDEFALSSDDREIRLIVKEQILKYTWPEFFELFFEPSVKGNPSGDYSRAWRELENACTAYETNKINERLKKELERIKQLYDNNPFFDSFDYSLITYLTQKPLWSVEEVVKAMSPSPTKSMSINNEPKVNVDEDFMRAYVSSTAASSRNDPEGTLRSARAAYQLAKDYTTNRLPTHRADEVGNLALRAEGLKDNAFADELYQLALRMKPDHAQNMQNYVSFIGDMEYQDRYDRAKELLTKLEKDYPTFKPGRTLALKAQIARLTGLSITLTEKQISGLFDAVDKNPQDFGAFGTGLRLLSEVAHDYSAIQELTVKALGHVETVKDIYARIRGFADAASTQFSEDAEKDAMEIYRRLLANREYIPDPNQRADAQHNYAVLLYKFDYDAEAGRLWYDAYQQEPQDTNVRNAYASYLLRANRPELAERVFNSQPLSEPLSERLLQSDSKIMPQQFSDAKFIDDWFKQLDVLIRRLSGDETDDGEDNKSISELGSLKPDRTVTEISENQLKELGQHPDDDKPVNLSSSSDGLYVKHGRTKAQVPSGIAFEQVTLEVALKLLRDKTASRKLGRQTSKRSPQA